MRYEQQALQMIVKVMETPNNQLFDDLQKHFELHLELVDLVERIMKTNPFTSKDWTRVRFLIRKARNEK